MGGFWKFEFRILNKVLAIIGAQPNRFILQIVQGADHSDGFAFRPHQE
jgi:hypothetical protein